MVGTMVANRWCEVVVWYYGSGTCRCLGTRGVCVCVCMCVCLCVRVCVVLLLPRCVVFGQLHLSRCVVFRQGGYICGVCVYVFKRRKQKVLGWGDGFLI